MNRIKVLPKETVDKIAAGEVIDNPLSVVKELVENSIDAGSDLITVEIKNGGKEYIRVSDNGSGIEKEDLKLAVFPHATSKIRFAEDLSNISSLGFRGEALSSIAAVSNTELISKTEEEKTGRKLVISAGKIEEETDTACDTGTTVIVRDLFFNLPARRKFLKADNRESSYISEFISRMALAYPDVRMRFICDGTIRFSTPGKGDIYQTILTVYSPKNVRKLLKLHAENEVMSLKGYISSPLESRTDRKQQIFFVNGRLVVSAVMENAVKTAYSDKLFEGRYPAVYLFLEIDPSLTDVNVHPRKSEIRFSDDNSVTEFIVGAIRDTLLGRNVTAIEEKDIKDTQLSNDSSPVYEAPVEEVLTFEEETYEYVPPVTNVMTDLFKELRKESREEEVQESFAEEFTEEPVQKMYFSSLRPVAQLFTTYILATDDSNFYIIDQHAAHERIMYEKLLASFNSAETAGQLMLAPLIIELDKSKAITAESILPELFRMGFSIELFGESSYLVKEIPYFMEADEAESFLYEYFDSADELKGRLQLKRDEIISKSCKSAVKAHDRLSFDEMRALFKDMDGCENPFSCPHGRPTFIKISEYELEKMFRRK